MSSSAGTVRFRQGSGRICLDFIRTLRYRGTPDASEELTDGPALTAWIRQCGPYELDRTADPDAAQVELARDLRETVHALITTAMRTGDATSCGDTARRRLNQAAAHTLPAPALDASGRIHWQAGDPVAAVLALIARDALELATSPAIARVRECSDARCGALFLDGSRPGNRRWCSMGTCGNRAKKETLRGRAAHSGR